MDARCRRCWRSSVVALAIYAFAFRHPGGKLTDYDAYALRTFANFYLTMPALIAALVGYALVARGLFWRDPAFIVTLTAFSLFFFYKIRIVPEHFWMARRFVPVILPGALLLVAGAALTGVRGRLLFTRAIRGPIGIVFLALLGGAVRAGREAGRRARRVRRASSRGSRRWPRQIGDDDLLIVESRDAGSDVHVLALPLAYIYARNVLVLSTPCPTRRCSRRSSIARARTIPARAVPRRRRHRPAVVALERRADRQRPVPGARVRRRAWNAYPRVVGAEGIRVQRLRVRTAGGAQPAAGDLDVGINDDLNVIRFHAKERSEGRTFRWSQARSFLIAQPHRRRRRARSCSSMNDGGRPPAAPPADVTVLDRRIACSARFAWPAGSASTPSRFPPTLAAAAAATGEPVRITLQDADVESAGACSARPTTATSASWSIAWR